MAATGERLVDEISLAFEPVKDKVLKSVWATGKQLFVFQTEGKPDGSGESHTTHNSDVIFEVGWNAEMHHVARKLINETHNIFVMLQGQVKSLSQTILHTQLKKASKQYRAVLKACSLEVMQLADACDDEQKKWKYELYIQDFEMVQLVWSLCEIIFIDITPGGLILSPLLDWLRWHFPEGKNMAMEIIQEEQPSSNPNYWEAVYRLILQGNVETARRLLELHIHSHTDPFTSVDELLKKMPHWTYQHAQSSAEYEMKWRHWREECIRRYETGEFAASCELERLVQILCGDNQVFKDLKDLCHTWYHLLLSKMLYQNPTVRLSDLVYQIKSCQAIFNLPNIQSSELDNILQAALEFDIHQVIKDSCNFLSKYSWWFVSHLGDILHHCGILDPQKLPFGSNLREYLLLEYASGLVLHKSLWQVGVDYFDFCPVFGREYLEAYIGQIPLDTEMKAQKVLHICLERDMTTQAQSVCKTMGRKCLQKECLGSALSWFIKSKDTSVIKQVTDKFLAEYCEQGKFSHLDLIDHLGPTMLMTSGLTFLGKYREFHTLYENGDVLAAANLLISLISSRLAPQSFWMTLLQDALPLINLPQNIFNVQQTFEMMHCLEELQLDRTSHAKNLSETELKVLRVSLTRNLAQAYTVTGTVEAEL